MNTIFKHKILFPLLIVFLILFSGCNLKDIGFKKQPEKFNIEKNSISETKEKYYAKFTGKPVDKNTYNDIPYAIIIENSKDARPQYGLNSSDIVYETMAEGGIPRFIVIFQSHVCNKIGPIRSVRPYFLNIANEYNIPFAHCGGSNEALSKITNENLMSINEIKNGDYFFRDKSKKAPHNLYTSSEKIKSFIKENNYIKDSKASFNFDESYWTNKSLENADNINLKANSLYSTTYKLNNNKYTKYIDKEPFLDSSDKTAVEIDNIIIQLTNISLQQDKDHLNIDLSGEGDCYIISKGKYKKGKWSRDTLDSKTEFKDENGNSIPLSPGRTWINIVDKKSTISIDN